MLFRDLFLVGLGVLFALGALAFVQTLPVAYGGPAGESLSEMGAAEPRRHLICRHFETDPSSADGGLFETADQTGEMGQWIASLESSGWRLSGVDFEFGQKPTGFLIAYTQICMARDL